MKYGTLAGLFSMFLIIGCGIEKRIDNATSKCESIVSEALEGLEETCLTGEDLLDLIAHLQQVEGDTNDFCEEDTLGEK
tara:strand:- start:119 stop:355 length:237 start_codon:yes stop_codon:yes gene_type:complete